MRMFYLLVLEKGLGAQSPMRKNYNLVHRFVFSSKYMRLVVLEKILLEFDSISDVN